MKKEKTIKIIFTILNLGLIFWAIHTKVWTEAIFWLLILKWWILE